MQHERRNQPWGLTPSEAEVMDAVVEHGSHKGAARALGRSIKTVEAHSCAAGQKIGGQLSRIRRYIEWDRWRRANPSEASK